ncbi:hypothetical protein [Specibacter sp. NPDC078692]
MEVMLALEQNVTEGNCITIMPLLNEELALGEAVLEGHAQHRCYSL